MPAEVPGIEGYEFVQDLCPFCLKELPGGGEFFTWCLNEFSSEGGVERKF